MARVLCVAPHPDDETLGCGATLLRHKAEGDEIHWLLVTEAGPPRFPADFPARRRREVAEVADLYGFVSTTWLSLPTAEMDRLPESDVIESFRPAIAGVAPDVVYLPHRGDAHSDHRITHDCAMAAMKPFRTGKRIRRILAYETLSETEQAAFGHDAFRPDVFVDVGDWLERKIGIMAVYAGEMQPPPLPREPSAVRALARLRGATVACAHAEAFMLLREVR